MHLNVPFSSTLRAASAAVRRGRVAVALYLAALCCVAAAVRAQVGQIVAPSVTVLPAPTVAAKDMSEAACLAFAASRLGLGLDLQDVLGETPRQTSRPDLGLVPGWGMELSALPDVARQLGMDARYRPGLSLAEAAALARQGYLVVYRAKYVGYRDAPRSTVPSPIKTGQMNPDCFAIVLLSVRGSAAQLYDPYLGIVTLPLDQVPEDHNGSFQPIYKRRSFGYGLGKGGSWSHPDWEAVVISPQTHPVPPMAARLGLPQIVAVPKTADVFLEVPLYLKSHRPARIAGRWLVDGAEVGGQPPVSYDLTSRGWQTDAAPGRKLTLRLLYDRLAPGQKHTIRFLLDSPVQVATGEISAWTTGFSPRRDGWQFKNETKRPDPLAWSGLCLGMSAVARDAFVQGTGISHEAQMSPATRVKIELAQAAGINHVLGLPPFNQGDLGRLRAYGSETALLAGETDRIRERIAGGKPPVLFLASQDREGRPAIGGGSVGHAVVGLAAFYCDDAYVGSDVAAKVQARVFGIYDPNFPNAYGSLCALADGNVALLRFLPEVKAYAPYRYLGEFTKDNGS